MYCHMKIECEKKWPFSAIVKLSTHQFDKKKRDPFKPLQIDREVATNFLFKTDKAALDIAERR